MTSSRTVTVDIHRGTILSIAIVFLAAGCQTIPETMTVDGFEMKTYNGFSVSCEKPYVLTQDCSRASGAKRTITIAGYNVKLAGSADGKVVMLMNSKTLTVNTRKLTKVAQEIRKHGKELGLELQSMEVAILAGEIESYFFVFDDDIYTHLGKL